MPTSAPERSAAPERVRPEKLTRTRDYARVQERARRFSAPAILVLVAPSEASPSGAPPRTRVGLTVSRKVGCAVVRNRVKRWLREAVREVGVVSGGPWDIVLVARPQAAEAGYQRLREEVARMLGPELARGRRP